jgi:predicted transcriptional regulator
MEINEEMENIIKEIINGNIDRAQVKTRKYYLNFYKVRGKGKGGKDCVRVDITPQEVNI